MKRSIFWSSFWKHLWEGLSGIRLHRILINAFVVAVVISLVRQAT